MLTEIFNGDNIKKLRTSKNMSQQDLANAIGVSKSSICGYEIGTKTPSLQVAIALSTQFDVSLDYIVHINSKEMMSLEPFSQYQRARLKEFASRLINDRVSDDQVREIMDLINNALDKY